MSHNKILKDPAIILGQGYSTDKQMAADFSCFANGTITTSGAGSNIIEFQNAMSFTEIQKALNIDVTAKTGIGPFSADASASYAKYVQDDFYSQSFYYYEQFFAPTLKFNPTTYGTALLNEFGQGVYSQGPETFRLVCGDEIVSEIQGGISLYASMKIKFNSEYDKQTFQAHAGVTYGDMISVSANVKSVVTQYNLNGEVDISAFQQGGDAIQLAKIFSKDSNSYYVTSCSLSNLEACQSTINGVISYAANNLPNQSSSYEPLLYTMKDITELGINTGNTTITPEIEEVRLQLGTMYANQTEQSLVVNHAIASQYGQYLPFLPELKGIGYNLTSNLQILNNQQSGVFACYQTPLQCIQIAEKIFDSLVAIENPYIPILELPSYNLKAAITAYASPSFLSPCTPCTIANLNLLFIPINTEGVYKIIGRFNDNAEFAQNSNILQVTYNSCSLPQALENSAPGEYSYNVHDNSNCTTTIYAGNPFGCASASCMKGEGLTGSIIFNEIGNIL